VISPVNVIRCSCCGAVVNSRHWVCPVCGVRLNGV